MARSRSDTLTEREAQIMGVLWSFGQATAEQVRELLPDRLHDSTVRTLLRVLETKGYVARQGPGKPIVYHPLISQTKAQRTAVRSLLGRLFGGSPEALVLRLIEDRQLTLEQLTELQRPRSDPRPGTKGDRP